MASKLLDAPPKRRMVVGCLPWPTGTLCHSQIMTTSISRQSTRNGDRLLWSPKPGIPIEQLLSHLKNVRDVSTEMFLKLPLPLADMLREWAERWKDEDLGTSLDATLS